MTTTCKVLSLTLPLPPSANRYWRHVQFPQGKTCPVCKVRPSVGRVLVSAEAKEYRLRVNAIWLSRLRDGLPIHPLDGNLKMTARVFREALRGDLKNYEKILCDALNGRAYHDDGQIVESHWFLDHDKANPRVEVEIEML